MKKKKGKRSSRLKVVARQTHRYIREHMLGLLTLLVAITALCVHVYVNVLQPDIRYIPVLTSDSITIVDRTIDDKGNFVFKFRIRPKFTNFSIKSGFVDKVEFDPQTVANLPDIKITSVDKVLIQRNEEKEINIEFLLTQPTDVLSHLDSSWEVASDLIMVAFDNTGKKIDKLANGPVLFGRIRFNLKGVMKAELKEIR